MDVSFIGIAGGSGSGKSTLCFGLWDKYPDKIAIVHLDDYFRKREEFPLMGGMPNADHPNVIRFDDFLKDLETLRAGQAIKVKTKSERLNPRYKEIGKIEVEIQPKPIILAEGYLALWDKRVRNLFATSLFLDMPHEARYARRAHFKDSEYEKKVLIPMHGEHVEPTKQYAKHIIDVATLSKAEVLTQAEKILLPLFVN